MLDFPTQATPIPPYPGEEEQMGLASASAVAYGPLA